MRHASQEKALVALQPKWILHTFSSLLWSLEWTWPKFIEGERGE